MYRYVYIDLASINLQRSRELLTKSFWPMNAADFTGQLRLEGGESLRRCP